MNGQSHRQSRNSTDRLTTDYDYGSNYDSNYDSDHRYRWVVGRRVADFCQVDSDVDVEFALG